MFEKIRSKRRIVGIRSDHAYNTTHLLVLSLTTTSTTTAFLLVIGIVREALVVAVKRWPPLLFSCQSCCWRTLLLLHNNGWWSFQKWIWRTGPGVLSTPILEPSLLCECWMIERRTAIQPFSSASSSSVNTFRQATNIFASCSCSFVGIRVARPWLAPSPEQWTYLFFTSTVEYCCSGTVAVAADVTLNDVEADLLGSCCCPFVGIRVGRHWHIRWKNELIYSSLHLSHIAVVALWP